MWWCLECLNSGISTGCLKAKVFFKQPNECTPPSKLFQRRGAWVDIFSTTHSESTTECIRGKKTNTKKLLRRRKLCMAHGNRWRIVSAAVAQRPGWKVQTWEGPMQLRQTGVALGCRSGPALGCSILKSAWGGSQKIPKMDVCREQAH